MDIKPMDEWEGGGRIKCETCVYVFLQILNFC